MGPFQIIRIILLILMTLSGLTATVMVLLQQSNSDATGALTNSSNTTDSFYGKNKGMKKDHKFKMWTLISGITLAVTSIIFFILG